MRPLVLTVHLVVLGAAPSLRAQGYEVWHVDGTNSSYLFAGGEIASCDDRDGDGVADLLVGSPQNQNYGTVTLLSGATGAVLWTITGDSASVGLGYRLAALGDVDGDGIGDLATMTFGARGYVYSGATQAFLHSFGAASNWAVVTAIADVDGDGARDYAVGDPQGGLNGRVDVNSGATGARLQRFDGEFFQQYFGRSIRGVGDVDADGVDDFMVGGQHSYAGSNHGKIWVYSGATLALIWRRTGNPGDVLGFDLAPVGDLDHDGFADVAASAVGANGGIGKLVIYSGFQGTVIREIAGDADGFFGWSLHPAGDVLGDGAAESKLLVSGYLSYPGDHTTNGRVDVVDAASGAILARIEGTPGEIFSYGVAGLGDVDGDGLADVAVSSPAFGKVSNYYLGRLTTFGWRFAPRVESVTPARGPHDAPTAVTVKGAWFDPASSLAVAFGGVGATNVQVVDHRTLTCDTPTGLIGPADVTVTTDLGAGTLAAGFAFTPALELEGDFRPGGSGVARFLIDPSDTLLGIVGLPPPVSIPVPHFDGELCIAPYTILFVLIAHPTDEFDLPIDIPNDPALSGLDVLLQALAGPKLGGKGKSGSFTNCATLHVE